ncbi:hypothetical protein ACIBG7_15150 [Nonomuraea sp. NPDC050328]|uniref:hypothetical protein n=1 Tax=Nonomuraea sp. NPDC050328 TaxID=3364361 RepID=UPI0037A4A7CF
MLSTEQITRAIARAEENGDLDSLASLRYLEAAARKDDPVRAAYDSVRTNCEWVSLAVLRDELDRRGLTTRGQQDAALVQATRAGAILIPEGNQKSLTPADWDAALTLGRGPRHLIAYGV